MTHNACYMCMCTCTYFVSVYRDHRDLHVLPHSFPTQRSSDLFGPEISRRKSSDQKHCPSGPKHCRETRTRDDKQQTTGSKRRTKGDGQQANPARAGFRPAWTAKAHSPISNCLCTLKLPRACLRIFVESIDFLMPLDHCDLSFQDNNPT